VRLGEADHEPGRRQGQFEGVRSAWTLQLRDFLGRGMASGTRYDSVLVRGRIKTCTRLGATAFRERFRREAQSVRSYAHHIVSVFDSGEEARWRMVRHLMEYVSAAAALRAGQRIARGAMPTEKALRITADVLPPWSEPRDGLVHRDINRATS